MAEVTEVEVPGEQAGQQTLLHESVTTTPAPPGASDAIDYPNSASRMANNVEEKLGVEEVSPEIAAAIQNSTSQAAAVAIAQSHQKSAGVTLALGLIVSPFWSYIYAGAIGLAFAWIGAAFISALLIPVVIGILLLPIVWVAGLAHSYMYVNRRNQKLIAMATGDPTPF